MGGIFAIWFIIFLPLMAYGGSFLAAIIIPTVIVFGGLGIFILAGWVNKGIHDEIDNIVNRIKK